MANKPFTKGAKFTHIREHPNFKERGLKKFHYTYKDISDLSGLKINTIQHLKLSGGLDPDKLRNIVNFIISKQESFKKEMLYNELIAAVKSRVSDRAKHKTALRYIREKEKSKPKR